MKTHDAFFPPGVAAPGLSAAPNGQRAAYTLVQHIQDTLLPSSCWENESVEFAGECERSGKLGGDFFDLLAPGTDQVLAGIGSVAVTGVSGSVLTTGLHLCLRLLGGRGVRPADLAGEINRTAWELAPDRVYATIFCARIEPRHGILEWVNAGHETALLIRSDLEVDRLEPNGPVLGLSRSAVYRECETAFRPGDALVAVSDGVFEDAAAPASSAECPEDVLLRLIRENGAAHFHDVPHKILDAVRHLAGTGTRDRTVIVIRRRRDAAHGRCLTLSGNGEGPKRRQATAA